VWLIAAFLLEASARAALGEQEAAGRALERGLDLAESDGLLFPFLLHPMPELLERHARPRTAHSALIWKIISMLGGKTPAVPAPRSPEQLPEPLSQAEVRVLRFLPTSLSAPEIARELYVSVNTVRMHMRHLYDKLGAHRRLEAIDRARALGLLTLVPQSALALISAGRIQGGAWVPVCEPLHGLLRSAEKSLDPACPNWMATTSGVRQSGEFAQCGNAIARDHGGGPRMADECYAWKIRYLMQALATSYPARSISLCIVEIFT